MSDAQRFLVEQLNNEPFNRDYTLVSFDKIKGPRLIQLLNDVIAEIDSDHACDLRDENPEDTAMRMLEFLRILKYKPTNVQSYRKGLVEGTTEVVYPLLAWLLRQMEPLKQRAYLARYLKKLEVPIEVQQANDVKEIYETYLKEIEDFKEAHKALMEHKKGGFSTKELKTDIKSMEGEKTSLVRRVQQAKKKVEDIPGCGPMLDLARELRKERDKEQSLSTQLREQKNQLLHTEQRLDQQRLKLKEIKASNSDGSAETMISRLEEEVNIQVYLQTDKLPKAIDELSERCAKLQKVANIPAMTEDDLELQENEVKDLERDINRIIDKRMKEKNPMDDRLTLFRQQALIVTRKKEAAADHLKEVSDELTELQKEYEEKQSKASDLDDVKILKGDNLKKYVADLRSKSSTYKRKKRILNDMRAELGILQRTESLLKTHVEQLDKEQTALEEEKGVAGYQSTQDKLEKVSATKGQIDSSKGKTLAEMSDLVKELMGAISNKRQELAPMIKELRESRTETQSLEAEYNDKKELYDNAAAGLETNLSRIQQEIKTYQQETAVEESRYHYLNFMNQFLDVNHQRVKSEMRNYVSNGADGDKKKKSTYRDKYIKMIQMCENKSKDLRDQQKAIKELHQPNMRQLHMWSDLRKLMQCKIDSNKHSLSEGDEHVAMSNTQDHLVL